MIFARSLKMDPKNRDNPTLSTPEARGRRLKQLRELTGTEGKPLTRAAIERKYGLSARTLKNWEYGHGTGLTERGAREVINIYQKENIACSVPWLMDEKGSPPQRRPIALNHSPMSVEITDPISTISIEEKQFKSLHPEGITFEVKDDAMIPFYRPGDLVGGVRHYAEDIDKLLDCDCIVEVKSGEVWLRRLHKSTVPGQYNLYAINPSTKTERPTLYGVEILAAAPVMRHWRGKKWMS
jgi:hypothetical protein